MTTITTYPILNTVGKGAARVFPTGDWNTTLVEMTGAPDFHVSDHWLYRGMRVARMRWRTNNKAWVDMDGDRIIMADITLLSPQIVSCSSSGRTEMMGIIDEALWWPTNDSPDIYRERQGNVGHWPFVPKGEGSIHKHLKGTAVNIVWGKT